MTTLLRLYAPTLVLGIWTLLAAVDAQGTFLTAVMLALLTVAVGVHTREMFHRHGRH